MGFFRLESSGNLLLTDLPRDFYIDACKAEFARVAPPDPARGPPLRERLKPDEPFWYGRDYDAAHLKAHPEEVTTSIRLFRGSTEIKSYAAMSLGREGWAREAELMMTATTRKDRIPQTLRITCKGEGDEWYCFPSRGACTLEADRPLNFQRGLNGAIRLANPRSGLPIVDMCAPEGKGVTRSDNRIFRLTEAPLSACRL